MRRAVVGLDTVAAGLEPRLLLQAVARVGDVTPAPSTIEVVTTEPDLPAVPVVGVPEYEARNCIE